MMKRLNYLDDYSVKTADVDQERETYRIERDVAIAAIGRPSLTAVPTETPAEQRERLIKLREHAVSKLHRMDRGRRDWAFGLKTGDLATGAGRAAGPGAAAWAATGTGRRAATPAAAAAGAATGRATGLPTAAGCCAAAPAGAGAGAAAGLCAA